MKSIAYLLLVITCLTNSNCVTIFSDFQSAETLGEGNREITPAASYVGFSDESERDHVQTNIGVLAGYGVNEALDIRGRVEFPVLADEFDTFGDIIAVSIGPKIKIGDNNASLYSPIGLAFGKDVETSESVEWHPTLFVSRNLKDDSELNGSIKIIVPFEDERDKAIAFNLGLAKWSATSGIRPEIGVLKFINLETGFFFHFGVAISFRNF